MKKLLFILILFPSLSFADVWEGWYAGMVMGQSRAEHEYTFLNAESLAGAIAVGQLPDTSGRPHLDATQNDMFAGGRLGYNWRSNK